MAMTPSSSSSSSSSSFFRLRCFSSLAFSCFVAVTVASCSSCSLCGCCCCCVQDLRLCFSLIQQLVCSNCLEEVCVLNGLIDLITLCTARLLVLSSYKVCCCAAPSSRLCFLCLRQFSRRSTSSRENRKRMSGGRYYQYHQSDNPFALSESASESCEDTHPLHYTNPFDDDGEGEATSAATLPPELGTLKAPPSIPKAIYRYSKYLKEEEEEEEEEHKEFEERQASLEKHIHNEDSLPLGIDDEFPSAATATAQSKNMEAPTHVEPISSFSEPQDEEELVTRQVSSAKSYLTRDRDLSSCPATFVQASSRHQRPNHNTERCELLETGRSDCKRIGAQEHEENRAVRDLQAYAMHKPQETLSTIKNCLRVAEQTKDAAGETMALLHAQGDQILRTHETVVKVDQHLTVAEKILGSLGGFFSRKWKPRLACNITGPLNSGGDTFQRQGCNDAERTALGLNTNGSVKSAVGNKFSGSTGFEQHDQVKEGILREEDALTDLSNVLGQLKDMSLQMHSEISRQNEGITYLDADVHELNYRVKGANDRGRQLLRR